MFTEVLVSVPSNLRTSVLFVGRFSCLDTIFGTIIHSSRWFGVSAFHRVLGISGYKGVEIFCASTWRGLYQLPYPDINSEVLSMQPRFKGKSPVNEVS